MPRKPASKSSTRKRPAARRAGRRPGKPSTSSGLRRKWRYVGALGTLLLVLFGAYLVYLNQIIDSRFEGGAWALP
ncbi:hypothetical protein N8198_07980, partial [Gammaproteobacteria bacterium]|nr:hypothetical protein [Gammaproteobacteria bacterium]